MASYAPHTERNLLGEGYRYTVRMNGAEDVERCDSIEQARLRAAALNYADGGYLRYVRQIGLDGV
jgi:hypothetical protein